MDNHASRKVAEKMNIVIKEVIQVVNCNTVRMLNRIFNQLCSDTGSILAIYIMLSSDWHQKEMLFEHVTSL
jgi:hypothetical protein